MVYSTPPSFSDRNAGRLAWLAYLHLSSDFQRFRLLGDLLSVSQLFSFLSFFLSLEFIFNINSNKTSLAIAYSVFQKLSTAHRDNRPHCSRMIDLLPSSPPSAHAIIGTERMDLIHAHEPSGKNESKNFHVQ